MPKLDTKLEAEGAEFLVLSHLLLNRIPAYKTYTNMRGYDLVATNPETRKLATIQVKSRWRTNAPFFLIKHFNCDFVVGVRLNRGKKDGHVCPSAPEFFVLPVKIARKLWRPGPWSKIVFSDIPDTYKGNWSVVAEFLKG